MKFKTFRIIAVLVAAVFITPAEGARHFVDENVGSSGSGATWAEAFATLQEALVAAIAGDSIWVAEGIYYGGFDVPDSTIIDTFTNLRMSHLYHGAD